MLSIRVLYKWMYFLAWMYFYYDKAKHSSEYSKQLRIQMEKVGILGIKLGQYMCNRMDISTECMKIELQVLLDQNKIHPMKHTLELLSKHNMTYIKVGELIGSGSLTQVYRCSLEDQLNLVLKIKHPDVDQLHTEIKIVKRIIRVLQCIPRFRMLINIDWDEFFSLLEEQIDLRNEIKNIQKYERIYKNKYEEIETPQFIYGNEDFIVMTYCEGKPLHMFSKSDPLYKKAHLLFCSSFLHTLFTYQLIHGDIHEGNILVKENGHISIIDFGICLSMSIEQYYGYFSIAKFQYEPTYEHCYDSIESLIHPYSIYYKKIDLNHITTHIYDSYMNEYHTKNQLTKTFVTILTTYIQKYNVMLRGNMLSYFMNVLLLEGLSPYKESDEMSSILAVSFMRKQEFFMKECGNTLDQYYLMLMSKMSHELLEKYNI